MYPHFTYHLKYTTGPKEKPRIQQIHGKFEDVRVACHVCSKLPSIYRISLLTYRQNSRRGKSRLVSTITFK